MADGLKSAPKRHAPLATMVLAGALSAGGCMTVEIPDRTPPRREADRPAVSPPPAVVQPSVSARSEAPRTPVKSEAPEAPVKGEASSASVKGEAAAARASQGHATGQSAATTSPAAPRAPASAPASATPRQPAVTTTPPAQPPASSTASSQPPVPSAISPQAPAPSTANSWSESDAPLPADFGARATQVALGMLGRPYRLGGITPDGFDCSGLVYYSFGQFGVSVPRDTQSLRDITTHIPDQLRRIGDLVFFHIHGRQYSHVGFYVGEGRFLHAPATGGEVRIEKLSTSYWSRRYAGTRRLTFAPVNTTVR